MSAPICVKSNQRKINANQRTPARRLPPEVCTPSPGAYPYRLLMKCDKPTPIMPESGYGDPVGCSHCGARWGART